MKTKVLILSALLVASAGWAQKKPERPKVHSDFYFGSYPSSRTATDLMAKEQARLLVVGYHEGWDTEKIAKEMKLPLNDLQDLYDELEEQRLAGERSEYEVRPFMPVIRERDLDRIKDSLDRHSAELTTILQANWTEIDSMVSSLAGAKGTPKEQALYETVVSGILLGGMEGAFLDDKTLLPPGPRRATGQRFYAWLVEGDPNLAGTLKREVRESDGYTIVSIGSAFAKERVTLDQIRSNSGMLLDDADARKFVAFTAIFSRDKLLPFFRSKRNEFLKLGALVDSGKYVAFAEFFGWYYNQMVNAVTRQLVTAKRITPPAETYTYAVRTMP